MPDRAERISGSHRHATLNQTMEPRLQRRVQRYGWDLAAQEYEPLWQAQLADVRTHLLKRVPPAPGECVLDVACGTGLLTFDAARAVGAAGSVLGIDLSGAMVEGARRRGASIQSPNTVFSRMDAEALDLPDARFDAVLCGLGLMYMPEPEQALREMRRVLRPGGRLGLSVWGERSHCAWASLFSIVDAEVSSEVCPLFFRLGQRDVLNRLCSEAKFTVTDQLRFASTLDYADADEACDAAFLGGPVALAWSRFGEAARGRVRDRYLHEIEAWRHGGAYRLPAEFVIVAATVTA
jgi:ubiquinone/menaquinone biosynthesis C-methylase UbiE